MSGCWTSIRVKPAREGDPMPPVGSLVALWNRSVTAYPFEVSLKRGADGERVDWRNPGLWGDWDYDEDGAYLEFETSYLPDGLDAAATAIAARYPDMVVTTSVEWTGEDPEIDHATYRGGVLVSRTTTNELPVGYDGIALALVDALDDDLYRDLGVLQYQAALRGTVERTIAFLRQLGGAS